MDTHLNFYNNKEVFDPNLNGSKNKKTQNTSSNTGESSSSPDKIASLPKSILKRELAVEFEPRKRIKATHDKKVMFSSAQQIKVIDDSHDFPLCEENDEKILITGEKRKHFGSLEDELVNGFQVTMGGEIPSSFFIETNNYKVSINDFILNLNYINPIKLTDMDVGTREYAQNEAFYKSVSRMVNAVVEKLDYFSKCTDLCMDMLVNGHLSSDLINLFILEESEKLDVQLYPLYLNRINEILNKIGKEKIFAEFSVIFTTDETDIKGSRDCVSQFLNDKEKSIFNKIKDNDFTEIMKNLFNDIPPNYLDQNNILIRVIKGIKTIQSEAIKDFKEFRKKDLSREFQTQYSDIKIEGVDNKSFYTDSVQEFMTEIDTLVLAKCNQLRYSFNELNLVYTDFDKIFSDIFSIEYRKTSGFNYNEYIKNLIQSYMGNLPPNTNEKKMYLTSLLDYFNQSMEDVKSYKEWKTEFFNEEALEGVFRNEKDEFKNSLKERTDQFSEALSNKPDGLPEIFFILYEHLSQLSSKIEGKNEELFISECKMTHDVTDVDFLSDFNERTQSLSYHLSIIFKEVGELIDRQIIEKEPDTATTSIANFASLNEALEVFFNFPEFYAFRASFDKYSKDPIGEKENLKKISAQLSSILKKGHPIKLPSQLLPYLNRAEVNQPDNTEVIKEIDGILAEVEKGIHKIFGLIDEIEGVEEDDD